MNEKKIDLSNENIQVNNLDDSSILIIKSMSLNESGEYTCRVSNSIGEDSRTVPVKLECK